MIMKRFAKFRLRNAVFGCLFGMIAILGGVGSMLSTSPVYAVPEEETVAAETTADEVEEINADLEAAATEAGASSCTESMAGIGWIVCPSTGVIAKAVDFLYEKIESVLMINPVEMKDGQPIYEIWKYMRGITNIVFIIFLLVMVYSQLTGLGITNYGLKKTLPKLIVAAILVNLSFVICSLAVDVSNIVGNSLRDVFTSIEETTMGAMDISGGMKMNEIFAALAGGTSLVVGAGVIVLEAGALWMLIPTVLGAIVAVVIGLVTIAMRQAVVALLIMISPLAVVAYMLPNTEQWFKKWKDLLTRMLVFYPLFSLLFGASSLAGWAIIASAKDGFMVLLGVAVQIFPLFFSVQLMKMSGTILGTINSKLNGLMARPLAANRSWAESRRDLARARKLASGRVYTPSLALSQFLSNRKIARGEETAEHLETVKKRGMYYHARAFYDRNRKLNRRGERAFEEMTRNLSYDETVQWHKNNFEEGVGGELVVDGKKMGVGKFARNKAQWDRLKQMDDAIIVHSDRLKMETARGARIELNNAEGFHDRMDKAINAHFDEQALKSEHPERHQLHGVLDDASNLLRYNTAKAIMGGSDEDVHFAAADAAHAYRAQSQVMRGKFRDYFDLTEATQDVDNRLRNLTTLKDPKEHLDAIFAGLQTLNQRGDTDLVRKQLADLMAGKRLELGTTESQALANYLMFDVKSNDPFLRRFGKYINMETAAMFNENEPEKRRTRKYITMDEYVNGEYVDEDENGNLKYDEDGDLVIKRPKRSAVTLLKGTSFKDMERTAIKSMTEGILDASMKTDADGKLIEKDGHPVLDYEKFKANEAKLWDAIMPNIISDQFSYLSGSEQIMALSKGITGVNVNDRKFDWEGIFGKEGAKQLTKEQKGDYIDFVHKRTKTFLGGHVPVQISKTKTDMLEAVRMQYALKDEYDKNHEFLDEMEAEGWKKKTKNEYSAFEESHMDAVRKEFVGSFKDDALKGFVKMYHKGYQGEAKDGLIQLLEPDKLYEGYFSGSGEDKKRSVMDEGEDGMPVGSEDGAISGVGSVRGAELRKQIAEVEREYQRAHDLSNVKGFWDSIKEDLRREADVLGVMDVFETLDVSVNGGAYTDVISLYTAILDTFFGGV